MSRIRAIILDFDGVLVESNEEKTVAFDELFALYPDHREAMMAYHLANYSAPRMVKFEHFVNELMGSPDSQVMIDKMAAQFSDLVVRRVVACPTVPGAMEFLHEFSVLVPLYIASVTPQEELRTILKARDLESYIVEAFGNPPCPKLEAIGSVLQREGLRPSEVGFVGDSASDYRAAASADLVFFGRNSGLSFDGIDVELFADMVEIAAELRKRI